MAKEIILKSVEAGGKEDELYYMHFYIKIEDNGIGMRQSGMDKIFINFSKLDNGNHLNQTGTGLGLSICK